MYLFMCVCADYLKDSLRKRGVFDPLAQVIYWQSGQMPFMM